MFLIIFSVLTSVDESVKLCVKIIVVKVVNSVLLKWSRISPKHVVTLDGELYGKQYENQQFLFFICYLKSSYESVLRFPIERLVSVSTTYDVLRKLIYPLNSAL